MGEGRLPSQGRSTAATFKTGFALGLLLVTTVGVAMPARALPAQLNNGIILSLSLNKTTLNATSEVPVTLSIDGANTSGQPVLFTYFGAWFIQSYMGTEFDGSIPRTPALGHSAIQIVVQRLTPRIATLLVTVAAYSGNYWAVNETSLIVFRADPPYGTFGLSLSVHVATVTGGVSVFVTSYSTSLLGNDLANVSVLYFSADGQFTPN